MSCNKSRAISSGSKMIKSNAPKSYPKKTSGRMTYGGSNFGTPKVRMTFAKRGS